VLLGMIILGIALFRPKLKHARMPESGWRKRWFVLQEDLALIGHSGYLWAALGTTVLYMLLQVVPLYVLLREYNFNLSGEAAAALMILIRLAAALPQAPATLGLFQVLTREYLGTFTDKQIIDPKTQAQVAIALTRDSREDVDAVLAKGLAAGGSEPRPVQDYGFMYSRDLDDPDGNNLSFLFMEPAAAEMGPEAYMAQQGAGAEAPSA